MTTICRGSHGAVRLTGGDYVAYVTVKHSYEPAAASGRQLIGEFRVIKRCDTHEGAANWCRTQKIVLPSNCFVLATSHLTLALQGVTQLIVSRYTKRLKEFDEVPEAVKFFNYAQGIKTWAAGYQGKVKNNSTFIITEPVKGDIINSVQLTVALGERIFGPKFPNTRSLRRITDDQFWQLMELLLPAGNL